jgi:hypothetical protein
MASQKKSPSPSSKVGKKSGKVAIHEDKAQADSTDTQETYTATEPVPGPSVSFLHLSFSRSSPPRYLHHLSSHYHISDLGIRIQRTKHAYSTTDPESPMRTPKLRNAPASQVGAKVSY